MIDGWEDQGCTTVVSRPEYLWELQEYRQGDQQMVFMHLKVYKWTKSTMKQAQRDFRLFRTFVKCPLFAAGSVDDAKFEHFVRRFGFRYLTTVRCTDGKKRRVFINFKDKNNNGWQFSNCID